MTVNNKEKTRKIYDALPKMDCGLCGFESCGKFARAIAEGRASLFGCRQDPWAGYTIREIVGQQPASPEVLGQEIRRLARHVDDILVRIEKLRAVGSTPESRHL